MNARDFESAEDTAQKSEPPCDTLCDVVFVVAHDSVSDSLWSPPTERASL